MIFFGIIVVCVLVLIALYIDMLVVLKTLGRKSILDVSEAAKVVKRVQAPDASGFDKGMKLKLYGVCAIAGVVTVLAFLLHRGASQCAFE
jgi:hypothetical protein